MLHQKWWSHGHELAYLIYY